MEQAALIEKLSAEVSDNKQTVKAVQFERDALARTFQSRCAKAGKKHKTVDDLASQLHWMTQLLHTLKTEQERVEKILRVRLNGLLASVPAADKPKYGQNSRWNRLMQLAARGIHVAKTEGYSTFLIRSARRTYRKLATWLPWRNPMVSQTEQSTLPFIFRLAESALEADYSEWMARNEPDADALEQQRQTVFSFRPRISVVVPCYNTPLPFLMAMIESVRAQTYPHWELCIADGGGHNPCSQRMLAYYANNDERIKVSLLPANEGIAGNSAQALSLATGEYVALLDHDDILSPFALFEIVAALNHYPNADVLYSDEDRITETGQKRFGPHFKPAWSPDTLRSINYITHLTIIERALLNKVGGFRPGFDGSQDYDLILRATEKAREIVHIPKVLYHWRSHAQSVAGNNSAKPYAYEAAKKALQEHLQRCRIPAHVQRVDPYGYYRIFHHLPRRPLVSIVIPNRDHRAILRNCLESIFCSTYTNYEILIVENNSEDPNTFAYYAELAKNPAVKIIPWHHPFNYAAAINYGVSQSRAEMLLLLNNDVEIINRDWLECLLEYALRPDVGAVGAKLYYPNNTIQHGGVVIGIGNVAGHIGIGLDLHNPGYMGRLVTVQNLSAVTAACLMTSRTAFTEVGGLDERYTVALNDIDFCLKLRSRGYLIVWTPYAQLYHFESLTRGSDLAPENRERFASEKRLFAEKWTEIFEKGDPFYNPNQGLHNFHWHVRINGAGPQHPRIVFRRRGQDSLAA